MSTAMARQARPTKVASLRDSEPIEEPTHGTERLRDQTLYAVVLHNDDRHTLRFCSALLREVFQCSEATACVLTWQIHTEGRAIVWSGNLDAAEQKCEEAERFQRRAIDSESRSAWDLDAGQPPMRTTIERIAAEMSPGDRTPRTGGDGRR